MITPLRAALLFLLMAPAAALAAPAKMPEPGRGELLYENHCQGCHVSALHVRADHKARTAGDVEDYVRHWADASHLGWSGEDVLDVTTFLVERYYTFPRTRPPPPSPPGARKGNRP